MQFFPVQRQETRHIKVIMDKETDKATHREGESTYGILVREEKDGTCRLMITPKVPDNGVGRNISK